MKLSFNIYKTPLNIAVEKGNIDIIKLLLSCKNINVNVASIPNEKILIKFIIIFCIQFKINLYYRILYKQI